MNLKSISTLALALPFALMPVMSSADNIVAWLEAKTAAAHDTLSAEIQGSDLREASPGSSDSGLRIVEMRVEPLLQLLAEHHGLSARVSTGVRGLVTDLYLTGDIENRLQTISEQVPIDWFIYDNTLEVSSKRETITRFVPLGQLSFDHVRRVLREASIDPERYSVRAIADEGAVRVSGPPKAVDVIEALIVLTAAEIEAPAKRSTILVRRGTTRYVESHGQAFIAAGDVQSDASITPDISVASESRHVSEGQQD